MDEKYSREELNRNLYRINEDHKFRNLIYYVLLPIFVAMVLFTFLTENVNAASDYHNVVTNAVYTGTTHCSSNQNGICVSDTSSTTYSRYTFGTTSYQNTLSMNFTLNTSVRANVKATVRLTGSNWANVNYICQSSHFTNCRVVRASSTILNVNFTNSSTSAVTYAEFFIQANGSSLNTNSTFYVQKADLYETIITTSGGSSGATNDDIINSQNQNTQDIINNQNDNTEDIINNNNSNTQDIIENDNNNMTRLIDKSKENMLAELNQQRTQLIKNCSNAYDTPLKIGKTLNNSGQLVDLDGSYYTEDYINIDFISGTKTRLYIDNPPQSVIGYNVIAYDSNKNYLGRVPTATRSWAFPSGTQYFRFSSPVPNTFISANQKCLTHSEETNNLIKDDNVDNDQANSFFSDFTDNDHGGLSAIISKPLTIINNLLSNNNSCSNLQLPQFMGVSNASLPSGCILWNNAPSSVVTIWNTLVVGLGSYFILKSLFKDIQALKDPSNDKVEVMDL